MYVFVNYDVIRIFENVFIFMMSRFGMFRIVIRVAIFEFKSVVERRLIFVDGMLYGVIIVRVGRKIFVYEIFII